MNIPEVFMPPELDLNVLKKKRHIPFEAKYIYHQIYSVDAK